MMNLAPIGVSTYARVNHLRQTITALQNSPLALQSNLYVFSDAPKLGDEEKVRAVRAYLKTVKGFNRVEIIERETNSRVNNNRQGMRMLLDNYGKMIFMEEDVVTAPAFLTYMNQALITYKHNPKIFSIAGYCPPIDIPSDYPYDAFLHPRFNPWGFGIWKDRFDLIEMKISKQIIETIYLNPVNLYRFSRSGWDMIPTVIYNYFEYGDGLDIKILPQQFVLSMLTVYPTTHLVDNIGLDGSGMHKRKKPYYRVELLHESRREFSFPADLEPNPEIMRSFFKVRSGSVGKRIGKFLWLIFLLLRKGFEVYILRTQR